MPTDTVPSRHLRACGVPLVGAVLLLLYLAPGTLAASTTPSSAPLVPPAFPTLDPVALTVSPSAWTIHSGASVSLVAAWVGVPPGCSFAPGWFRWNLEGPDALGYLTSHNGSTVTFVASTAESGQVGAHVEAVTEVDCGAIGSSVVRAAGSNLTVAAPLVVRDLSVGPDPLPLGGTAYLLGSVGGGLPPYTLTAVWGDGTSVEANQSSPGPFVAGHRFDSGSFAPSLIVVDADGTGVRSWVPERLIVTDGFAVALAASSPTAESGLPVVFRADLLRPPANLSTTVSCPNATVVTVAGPGPNPPISCTFVRPGPVKVGLSVSSGGATSVTGNATLREVVAPPLTLSSSSRLGPVDVGGTLAVPLDVEGGVPPFAVRWHVVGGTGVGAARTTSDGPVYASIPGTNPGWAHVAFEVRDALGATASLGSPSFEVLPAVNGTAEVGATIRPNGVDVGVAGGVFDGEPPYFWAVSAPLAANRSISNGILPSVGTFSWAGTVDQEGAIPALVTVVDAAGAIFRTSLTTEAVAPLSISVRLDPGSSAGFRLTLAVGGGLAPFTYRVNDSAGDGWNGSLATDGTFVLDGATDATGLLGVTVTVLDAFGASTTVAGNVSSTAGGSGTTGTPVDPGLVAGIVALFGVLVASAVLWRRRRRAEPPPAVRPEPTEVLRRIIEPSDGADRATVELLAEEEGVPRDTTRTTLDRLIGDGTVRSERGSDGEEVLAWSRVPPL